MTENAMVILLAMFLVSGMASGLGIAVGVRLGKDRVKSHTLLRIDSVLRIERILSDEPTMLTPEQRNDGLLTNLKELRQEVKTL